MTDVDVSVIIPIYNCRDFIKECLESITNQNVKVPINTRHSYYSKKENLRLEISIYDDGSNDETWEFVKDIENELNQKNIKTVISRNFTGKPKGVGHGRNRAVEQSNGTFLCFCDGDDYMKPNRIVEQYLLAIQDEYMLIGCNVERKPLDSTKLFTQWANSLTPAQLSTRIFDSFGPTILMPTWFCHRNVYYGVGEFDEGGLGVPEDLIFFYQHLNKGRKIGKVDEVLQVYRYNPNSATFSVKEETIYKLRLDHLEKTVLSKWPKFSIWNAGKLGRRFFRQLQKENQDKVEAFCDVDEKKLNLQHYNPHPSTLKIPIVHFSKVKPPLIICIKTEHAIDLESEFMKNLNSLNLQEGIHYFYFN